VESYKEVLNWMRKNLKNLLFILIFSTIFWSLTAFAIFATISSEIPGIQDLPNIIEKLNYAQYWPIFLVLIIGYTLTIFAGFLILYEKEFWRETEEQSFKK